MNISPENFVDLLFEYIESMGNTSKAKKIAPIKDLEENGELLANVYSNNDGINFDGFDSSPFISKPRLVEFLNKRAGKLSPEKAAEILTT